MAIRLRYLWEQLRTSYWFVPSLMLLAAAAMAWLAISLDSRFGLDGSSSIAWALVGSSAGATAVMSTVAGSMVTIAGVVFSITLVALSLASGQFGPRMLRNFIRDRINQSALGAFLATFLYCLLVLSAIRHGAPQDAFVPRLAVGIGVLLAVASVATLIFYIHHVAMTIQADTLIENIYADLCQLMDTLYPARAEAAADRPGPLAAPHGLDAEPACVPSPCHGYVQAVDHAALVAAARAAGALVRLERGPGDYVLAEARLMSVWPPEALDEACCSALQACVVFGAQRTATQDMEFALDQLVEIAARALSPGVNDPFTAITCVDRLSSALCRLGRRPPPDPWHFDDDGASRLIAPPVGFSQALDAAFNPLRQYACDNPAVAIRMMEALDELAALVTRQDDLAALRRHADMLLRGGSARFGEPSDRADLRVRHARVMAHPPVVPSPTQPAHQP